MRNYFLTFMLAAIAVSVACANAADPPVRVSNSTPAVPAAKTAPAADVHQDDGHDAPRITLADAKKDFDAGTAVIVDVRDAAAYDQEHIKGAINITKATLDANLDKLPKGKKIIVYCS